MHRVRTVQKGSVCQVGCSGHLRCLGHAILFGPKRQRGEVFESSFRMASLFPATLHWNSPRPSLAVARSGSCHPLICETNVELRTRKACQEHALRNAAVSPNESVLGGTPGAQRRAWSNGRRWGGTDAARRLCAEHRIDLFESTCIEPMRSCGFATQTSEMSGPPNSLWPEASTRGSLRTVLSLGATIFTTGTRHALHSLSLVQGRATR